MHLIGYRKARTPEIFCLIWCVSIGTRSGDVELHVDIRGAVLELAPVLFLVLVLFVFVLVFLIILVLVVFLILLVFLIFRIIITLAVDTTTSDAKPLALVLVFFCQSMVQYLY